MRFCQQDNPGILITNSSKQDNLDRHTVFCGMNIYGCEARLSKKLDDHIVDFDHKIA